MAGSDALIEVCDVGKSYAAPVLVRVSLQVRLGEVHALVGENGAGKSTLARIVAGLTRPDSGHLLFQGQSYAPASRLEAERQGVRMVMQELNLIGNLTVAENIFLGRLPHRHGWVDYRSLNAEAAQWLDQIGLGGLDPTQPVKTLGVGQQQLVEIAACLSQQCTLLILDEPTAALTGPEIGRLFAQIARLKAAGTGILYISHRLEEIQRLADRVSVLRDGKMVGTRAAPEVSLDELVQMMVGRELREAFARESRLTGPPALRVRGLRRGVAVRDVSFEVRAGEILGFAGLMGAGRTETMRAVFGADRPDAGAVYLHDSTSPARIRSPRDAVKQGLALLTEDRKAQGLLLPLAVKVNITLLCLRRLSLGKQWIRRPQEQAEAGRWAERLSIRCNSTEQRVVELSGGNQQKAVMARWLSHDCDIFIFDEPTRGIDVGAKFEIYRLLVDLADQGKALIVVSSDLLELMALCDRIAVMASGRITATFARGEWSQDKIMAAALPTSEVFHE